MGTIDAATPKGERFSRIYLERGEPTVDNVRMRRRLSALVRTIHDLEGLAGYLSQELGVDMPYIPYAGVDWDTFFGRCELRDVLDTVTLGARYLEGKKRSGLRDFHSPQKWITGVSRILSEENVRYRVDERGGVHFAIDREFESNQVATLAILGSARYRNVLDAFNETHNRLAEIPTNGKGAIRSTFAAAEGLFRLMFPEAPRLTSKEIDKHLVSRLDSLHADDGASAGAASKVLGGFKAWVDAAHFYRHEQGKEAVAQPPLPLAINLVSLGASYIRWLAEIDTSQRSSN